MRKPDFLEEYNSGLIEKLNLQNVMQILDYLADICSCMNDLSLFHQGKGFNILLCCKKLKAFKEEVAMWCRPVKRGNLSNFPSLEEMIDANELIISIVREEIVAHLQTLSRGFVRYFIPEESKILDEWFINSCSYSFIICLMMKNNKKVLLIGGPIVLLKCNFKARL